MATTVLTPSSFVRQSLGTTNATLYTVPSGLTAEIKQISIINRGSIDAKVYLYLVDSGDSAGNENVFLPGWTIEKLSNIEYGTWQVLLQGGTIQGYSNGSVTLHISGMVTK